MALPEDNSPVVAWLASEEAGDVTGRVIEIEGGQICVERAGRTARRGTPAAAGTRPRSGPRCASCSAKAPTPEPVYGA